MRVHVLQHVPFEGPGRLADGLAARGAQLRTSRLWAGDPLPAARELDWLVALGGPMSANDEATLPWIAEEKRLLADAVRAGRRVLGICLGAQLLAAALGAAVRRNPEREIGWFPVEPAPEAAASPFASLFRGRLEAFHWHGETFELPPGALPLARSAACARQAFCLGPRVVGLQFHLETTPEGARALAEHCAGDLAPGAFVQTPAEMLRDPARFARAHAALDALLAALDAAPAARAGAW